MSIISRFGKIFSLRQRRMVEGKKGQRMTIAQLTKIANPESARRIAQRAAMEDESFVTSRRLTSNLIGKRRTRVGSDAAEYIRPLIKARNELAKFGFDLAKVEAIESGAKVEAETLARKEGRKGFDLRKSKAAKKFEEEVRRVSLNGKKMRGFEEAVQIYKSALEDRIHAMHDWTLRY